MALHFVDNKTLVSKTHEHGQKILTGPCLQPAGVVGQLGLDAFQAQGAVLDVLAQTVCQVPRDVG